MAIPDVARSIASRFAGTDAYSIRSFSGGHIHSSFLITPDAGEVPPFLLQRLNRVVFPDPVAVMENIRRLTAHVRSRLARTGVADLERRSLALVSAAGGDLLRDDAGEYWRAYRYIENSRCEPIATSPAMAETCAAAFGAFLGLVADLPAPPLHSVLPGFHDTPARFEAFEEAVVRNEAGRRHEVASEVEFLRSHAALGARLIDLAKGGFLPVRTAHHDAKISNVLFDARTGEALCVVDLDLVMPGLALFDFGDMARSMVSSAAEDEADSTRVGVRMDYFEAISRGFLRSTRSFLTSPERAHLVDAAFIITLEQAARFLGDYLDGDRYYATSRPRQNLDRARNQIALFERLWKSESELRRIVNRFDE